MWFGKSPNGINTLQNIARKVAEDIPKLACKKITNKTGRNMSITCLDDAFTPIEYGMELTGHRDLKSYSK